MTLYRLDHYEHSRRTHIGDYTNETEAEQAGALLVKQRQGSQYVVYAVKILED